ncbi:MAG: CapA family protein [Ruminococcus sp.]|jgi:poly-gamma-glutamate synthesis protein (capsule biosynthesis protein)|nr:CapA family protein [Ruminococcus sp.]
MSGRKIFMLSAALILMAVFVFLPTAANDIGNYYIYTENEYENENAEFAYAVENAYENANTETAYADSYQPAVTNTENAYKIENVENANNTENAYENINTESVYNTETVYENSDTESAYNAENVYEKATEIPPEPIVITISAAGDFTLGGDVQSQGEERFAAAYASHTPDWFLENVADIFENDDITVVNLEGTLTTADTRRANRSFLFRGQPSYTEILTEGGVDVVNIANNHHNDFLSQGKSDTISAVKNADIGYFGYDDEYYIEKHGVTFGFLGFTEWDYTAAEITERITAAKLKYDVVIVSFHWGIERQYTPTKTQTVLGHAAVDAGADLVIGSHTHVLGEVENYNGVNIVYSLGNFCYGGHGNPSDKNTMIFQQDFIIDEKGTAKISESRIIPCTISSLSWTNDFKPTPKPENSL